MEAPIMEEMAVRILVMEVIPAVMTPVLFMAAIHRLHTHLQDMANNSSSLNRRYIHDNGISLRTSMKRKVFFPHAHGYIQMASKKCVQYLMVITSHQSP
jgi:hypothetical protein